MAAEPPLAESNEEENTIEPLVDEQIENIDLGDIKDFWDSIVNEYGGFLPESQKGSFMDFVKGDKSFSFQQWLIGALKFLFHELVANGKLLGSLILLAVFAAILQTIQNAFEFHAVSKVAYSITYMVLIILALNSFHVAINYTEEAIQSMMSFMVALIPLLLALLASLGNFSSVAFFHPVIVFLINTSSLLIVKIVLPLLFLSAILHVVSSLTDHYKVTKLANLLRNIALGGLGIFFALFLGVISIQGASSAIADGVTIRTAKFLAGNFIPVVGRMFTDATDTVLSASLLLKNTIGLAGVAILLLLAFFPAVKVLALALIFHIAGAVLQPLGGGPIVESLDVIGKSVLFIFVSLGVVSLMFFLTITIMIGMGNAAYMMR
ncbi:stage III sporulation protein AE [Pueribacillus theae]|uniref:Stage III sporulation protein AE n=2 Tax=Pueribacillus theae TaxID=2171751 RepID=A0A2U1K703_9BACI|nr:stage III sporulation protein AE [Pueribacillus theae]PWA13307.1 stage III sporulation protein AE [Pueribacillus theae]